MEHPQLASKFAFAAAALFVVAMGIVISQAPDDTFAGAPSAVVVAMAVGFIAFHLSLLPVVAALDAPTWAKGSGFAWIVVDNVLVFMSYFGVGENVVAMRWGVHLATASWIFGASLVAAGARKWVGMLTVLGFLFASFAGPFVSDGMVGQLLGPAALLLVVWLILVGLNLRTHAHPHPLE